MNRGKEQASKGSWLVVAVVVLILLFVFVPMFFATNQAVRNLPHSSRWVILIVVVVYSVALLAYLGSRRRLPTQGNPTNLSGLLFLPLAGFFCGATVVVCVAQGLYDPSSLAAIVWIPVLLLVWGFLTAFLEYRLNTWGPDRRNEARRTKVVWVASFVGAFIVGWLVVLPLVGSGARADSEPPTITYISNEARPVPLVISGRDNVVDITVTMVPENEIFFTLPRSWAGSKVTSSKDCKPNVSPNPSQRELDTNTNWICGSSPGSIYEMRITVELNQSSGDPVTQISGASSIQTSLRVASETYAGSQKTPITITWNAPNSQWIATDATPPTTASGQQLAATGTNDVTLRGQFQQVAAQSLIDLSREVSLIILAILAGALITPLVTPGTKEPENSH